MSEIADKTLELWKSIKIHIENQNLDEALEILDEIISNKIEIEPQYFKIQLVDAYVHIADVMAVSKEAIPKAEKVILKSIGLLKKYKSLLNDDNDLRLLYDSIYARSLQISHKINNQLKAIERGEERFDFTKIENIYDIKETIQNSIVLYRDCVNRSSTKEKIYANRNNLAISLSRVGRFVESMINYEENIRLIKDRPESNLSWADNLFNMKKQFNLMNCASIYYCIAERYIAGINSDELSDRIKNKIYHYIIEIESQLNQIGFELSDEKIEQNREEELADIQEHPELRKFSFEHQITLSEHALFCNCRDSREDNLEIGNLNPNDEQTLATIISEFAFARYLLFKYMHNLIDEPDDFKKTSANNSVIGYRIEHLKQSFKIVYSILDKIGNGILDSLNITRIARHTYFEDIFGHYSEKLAPINNISLCALYSLSLELNRSNGNLKYFKKLRNIMEHETKLNIVSEEEIEFSEEDKVISSMAMKDLTLNLMKLTRSAIFSFVFLLREMTPARAESSNL
ncbi:MAG: LA2681 family HEPN domain-containing protein [Chitinophagales bacterium]